MNLNVARLRPVLLALFAAVSDPASGQIVEEQVRGIREICNRIDSGKLASAKVAYEGESEPITATCTIFREGDSVVKIHLSWGGDHFASDEYFYYAGGKLIFVYASDGSWRFTGDTLANGESETLDEVVEHRVYVVDGKVIRHLEKAVQSTRPEQLKTLLSKAENAPGKNSERAGTLVGHGQALWGVRTREDLGKALLPEP